MKSNRNGRHKSPLCIETQQSVESGGVVVSESANTSYPLLSYPLYLFHTDANMLVFCMYQNKLSDLFTRICLKPGFDAGLTLTTGNF